MKTDDMEMRDADGEVPTQRTHLDENRLAIKAVNACRLFEKQGIATLI